MGASCSSRMIVNQGFEGCFGKIVRCQRRNNRALSVGRDGLPPCMSAVEVKTAAAQSLGEVGLFYILPAMEVLLQLTIAVITVGVSLACACRL